MVTPPPCKQSSNRESNGALEGAGAVEQSGGTYSLRRRESRRGTSSDVSSTIPMGHWNGTGVRSAERHVHTARQAEQRGTRRETSSDVSSTASIGALEGVGAVQQLASTYSLRRRESRREMMSVQRFHQGIGRGRSLSTAAWHSLPTQARVETEAMSVERFQRGIGRGVAFELHRDTYILPVEQSKTVTWRETSSDVS